MQPATVVSSHHHDPMLLLTDPDPEMDFVQVDIPLSAYNHDVPPPPCLLANIASPAINGKNHVLHVLCVCVCWIMMIFQIIIALALASYLARVARV